MAVLWELKLVSFWFVLVCYPFQLFSPRHLYLLIPYNTQAPRVFLALIQAQRDLVELRLRIGGQTGSSREVFPQQRQVFSCVPRCEGQITMNGCLLLLPPLLLQALKNPAKPESPQSPSKLIHHTAIIPAQPMPTPAGPLFLIRRPLAHCSKTRVPDGRDVGFRAEQLREILDNALSPMFQFTERHLAMPLVVGSPVQIRDNTTLNKRKQRRRSQNH